MPNPLLKSLILIAIGLLVTQSSRTVAQPPMIFPQPRLKSQPARVTQLPGDHQQTDAANTGDTHTESHDEWFLVEYEGATIGYESLVTSPIDEARLPGNAPPSNNAAQRVRRIRETRLKLRRFGNDLSVSAHLETIESSDGVLESWSLRRTAADGAIIQRSAEWDPRHSAFTMHGNATDPQKVELLPCRVQPRSPIVPAWLFAEDLDRPQIWESAVLFPETSAIVDVQIRQLPPQSIKLKSGAMITVTRIDYWPSNQLEMRSSVYYDKESQVVLVEQPLLGKPLRFFRTDAATALGEENLQSLDLQFLTALPLRQPLQSPEKSTTARFRISVGASEQISLPSSDFQTVEQTAANSVTVTLTRPLTEMDGSPATPPRSARTRPDKRFTDRSHWIDIKDDNVRRMAVIAGGAVSEHREKCSRLTKYVHSHMRLAAFSTSLLPAGEIAKSKQGDCTEYAVLLTALMRSQGVPARVAVGFGYVQYPPSYAPHMWTEAWIDGQWIPFDATLGGEVNPLTRIKVVDSALSDDVTNGTLLFIPLLNFLGRATVEILPE